MTFDIARSNVYFAPMNEQASQTPSVSLNTFSTWMAHLMGTSETHSVFHWKDSHRQEALEGVQALWTNPALKELAFVDPFDSNTSTKKSMVIISGVHHPEALLPEQSPSLYVDNNDAQDFVDVALDTMTHYTEKSNVETQKVDCTMTSVDTKLEQIIDSFKAYYDHSVDTNVFDTTNKADQAFMVEIEKLRGMELTKDLNVVEMTGLEQLAKAHGAQSAAYKEAQKVVSDLITNDLMKQQQDQQMTLVLTPFTNQINKRAPVEKINAVSDFQLLFWTGVFLVLVVSGVLAFVYQLGNSDAGNVVLTTTSLPKQD
ncbi:hypothetical protein BCR42DRAFT_403283 [Absidia repens]|uniref:Uncharacterized protein n=1 Tax=Absidia repens TaxID=90262 RepID=A0A1X2IZ80_9FUNG|nr:hypothetical protein BCR42DRAFT_403283 [Absidia repens]